MSTHQLARKKVINKNSGSVIAKPAEKKINLKLVKVTIEEINAIRPGVYKLLLP